MFRQTTTAVAAVAAAVLALTGRTSAADSTDINSVLTCTSNIYADGFIYQNKNSDGTTSSNLAGFPAKVTFPLALAVTSHSGGPLDPVQLAQQTGIHDYTSFGQSLYINVSTGAFAPVSFVTGDNSTLGPGETTYGFYDGFGFFMWYNPTVSAATGDAAGTSASNAVHVQGFQWVPVEGYAQLTQLYWNQTQYDLAAAEGTSAGINASAAQFGVCSSDAEAVVTAS